MSFRIVWHGRFGKESSQLIDELERARFIASALALRKKMVVYVVNVATGQTVYSAFHEPEKRPFGSRTISGRRGPPSSG